MVLAHSFASLREEDSSWDYRGEFTKRLTHGLHSYPAMMIPQVAARLIEAFSKPGDVVLDPFCGSGSVLVEAKALGRHSWGIDLNPVALLVAKAKTTPLAHGDLKHAFQELRERLASSRPEDTSIPTFFNIDYWFKPNVSHQLAQIKLAIDSLSSGHEAAIRDFFLVAFSETVRLSSNSRSHEFKLFRYPEAKLASYNPQPLSIFLERVERNIERMLEFASTCRQWQDIWCRPFLADSTLPNDQIPDASVDVVVTSPPYGDSRTTVAYGQFTRLSAQWLGFDDEQARGLDSSLMGGRPPETLDNHLHSPALDCVLREIAGAHSLRAPGSFACHPERSEGSPGRTGSPLHHDRLTAETDLTRPSLIEKRKTMLRARQVLGFYIDIGKALTSIAQLVHPGGYLCIVIGNRRVNKVQLPTDVIIAEMAASMGLTPARIIVRNIPSKTMPLKNSPTNIAGELELTMHEEYIVVIKK